MEVTLSVEGIFGLALQIGIQGHLGEDPDQEEEVETRHEAAIIVSAKDTAWAEGEMEESNEKTKHSLRNS